MTVKETLKKFISVFGMILCIHFLFNLIMFLISLFKSNFEINQFAFKNGYFMLNHQEIGQSVFLNLTNTAITSIIVTLYLLYKSRTKSE
jgi:hypothetical protein